MTDPLAYAEIERNADILSDPEVEIAAGVKEGVFSVLFVRRRGVSRDPSFRFRDPDRA